MIDLDIASTARSPGSKFELTVHQGSFTTAGLDSDEASLLEQQLERLVADQESSVLGKLVQQRQEAIAKTAAFAKQVFDEKPFEGVNAGDNAIGFSPLRPGHVRADPGTGNAENNWYFSPGTTGFVDWIGDGGNNNFTFTEDQVSIVLAMVDQDVDSEISVINVDEFGRNMDMLPLDVNTLRIGDNKNEVKVRSLPTLIGQENDDIHIRLRADRDVESQPRLYGFTFGLGSFLNTEDF